MLSPEKDIPLATKDLSIRPPDIRECNWWGPINFASVNSPKDLAQGRLRAALTEALTTQGHILIENPQGFTADPRGYIATNQLPAKSDHLELMLAFEEIPVGSEPLEERVDERETPLGLALIREYGLKKRPDNLVTFVTIPEPLGDRPHLEVVDLARIVMAKIGTPRVGFITGNGQTGKVNEVTLCTLEGGHPTISGVDFDFLVHNLRDRLVSLARTEQVGGKYKVRENVFSLEEFEALSPPGELIEAGARMDRLNLLPPPIILSEIVSSRLARIYERFLNMNRFSEGMLCTWDPALNCMIVSGSGSWGVDKRRLKKEHVVVVSGVTPDGYLIVDGVEGLKQPGPSVEARELFECFRRAPKVRLRQVDGKWQLDPFGPVETPIIRSILHAHVGIVEVNESLVEVVPSNHHDFPFAFCCGSDLNCDVSTDAVRRSRAINDPDDPRPVVIWSLDNHGIIAAELWKGDELGRRALQHALDMFDPNVYGAVHYTPDNIVQI